MTQLFSYHTPRHQPERKHVHITTRRLFQELAPGTCREIEAALTGDMAGYKKKLNLITFFICSLCCLLSGCRCKQTLRVNAPSYPLRQIPSFHSFPLLSLSLPPFFFYLFFISSLFTLIATTTTTTAISTQSHAELNCQKQCTLSFLLKKESGPLSAPFPSLSPIISQRVESVVLLLVAITWADRRMSMADVEETALVRGRMELGPPHRRHWHHDWERAPSPRAGNEDGDTRHSLFASYLLAHLQLGAFIGPEQVFVCVFIQFLAFC